MITEDSIYFTYFMALIYLIKTIEAKQKGDIEKLKYYSKYGLIYSTILMNITNKNE